MDGRVEDSDGEWMFARAEISPVHLAQRQRCEREIGVRGTVGEEREGNRRRAGRVGE